MGLNPDIEKLYSGFRPIAHYIALVGLNPEVEKLDSGFRPRGNYLAVVGLNPEVKKQQSIILQTRRQKTHRVCT